MVSGAASQDCLSPSLRVASASLSAMPWIRRNQPTTILHMVTVATLLILIGISTAAAQSWFQTSAPAENWYSIASSGDGKKLVAVAQGGLTNQGGFFEVLPGPVYISTNAGLSWSQSAAPSYVWQSVASSFDGRRLIAGTFFGPICISTNSGLTWSEVTNLSNDGWWGNVAISADGVTMAAAASGGGIAVSTNGGTSWEPSTVPNDQDWDCLAISADATKMIAGSIDGFVYFSINRGTTWTQASLPNIIWGGVAVSSNGVMVAAVKNAVPTSSGPIYISTNSGGNWTQSSAPIATWQPVVISSDGTRIVAANEDGQIYTSPDLGATWIQNTAPTMGWSYLAVSADGAAAVAVVDGGGIYTLGLGISFNGGDVHLFWPSNSLNFRLQESMDLSKPSWMRITNVPTFDGTTLQYEVSLPSTNAKHFYRVLSAN